MSKEAISLDDFRSSTKPSSKCAANRWLDELDDNVADIFRKALEDRSITTQRIYELARQHEARFSIQTLRLHRQGNCACR